MNLTTMTPGAVEICTDCLFLLANGEGPDDVAERLAERWPLGALTLGRCDAPQSDGPDDESDEPWFSWQPCDGCGSALGGDRHAATGWTA